MPKPQAPTLRANPHQKSEPFFPKHLYQDGENQVNTQFNSKIYFSEAMPSGACKLTLLSLRALILVENDGPSGAILDHSLGDGDSSLPCARRTARGIPFMVYRAGTTTLKTPARTP